jgi:peptidoglycan/xylan/chitin deacetylase (PgdA/CDA1 family)
MADRVLQRVQPGSIILAHDGSPHGRVSRDKTMAALSLIVDGLQKRGYRFVTVPELLALAPQKAPPQRNNKR